jgi:predicted kinase
MTNPKILILIGPCAAGKSTWALDYVLNNPSWLRVNRDDFRLMLKNQSLCDAKIENLITELSKDVIKRALAKRLNVIIDNTHLNQKYIDEIVTEFKYLADIDYRIFDISVDKAVERDRNRLRPLGEKVIKKMFKKYKSFLGIFDYRTYKKQTKPLITPNFSSTKDNAVIFDIDGTLALMHDNRGPFDWDKVNTDLVNSIVVEQIDFHIRKNRKVILLSGREALARTKTIEWLNTHNIYYDALYMRETNDNRKDSIVKLELYKKHIEPLYNVLCVYDDRLQVLDTWYKEGLFTFNVNQGNYIF